MANPISGTVGDDLLYGTPGDDELYASKGTDRLIASGGNDRYDGGARADGIPEVNTVDYSAFTTALRADLNAALLTTDGKTDLFVRIEALIGGRGDDHLVGGPTTVMLDGGPGNDTLDAQRPPDRQGMTLIGGLGNDTLFGNGSDTLKGGLGDDFLMGGGGGATLSYADAHGPVTVSLATGSSSGSAGQDFVAGFGVLIGSGFDDALYGGTAADILLGGAGADVIDAGAGNDEMDGGAGDDRMDGGAGNDLIRLDLPLRSGKDAIEGGQGFDRIDLYDLLGSFDPSNDFLLRIDMAKGEATDAQGVVVFTFHSIEALYEGKGWGTTLIGDEAANYLRGDSVSGGAGNDTLEGGYADYRSGLLSGGPGDDQLLETGTNKQGVTIEGASGLDTLRLGHWPASTWQFLRTAGSSDTALRFELRPTTNAPSVVGALQVDAVERFVFGDQCLAFGDRAIDVAKVAFALWNKAIAPSTTLFGKGIDWYDDGHSYRELIDFALTYYTQLSDAQFAQNLMANVPGSRSVSDVLALMAGHGGAQEGRAFVTQLFADDAANMAAIELAGFKTNGIACSLMFDDEALFTLPGS